MGEAIALDPPIGSSSSRVLTTLVYELRRRGGGRGLAQPSALVEVGLWPWRLRPECLHTE
jgi:acetyl-CoA acetyltransferase